MNEPRADTKPTPPDNRALVRRLFGLAWRYRGHCLQVLAIQLVLLTLGIFGAGFTGIGIDYIQHRVTGRALSASNPLHVLPEAWTPFQVLGLIAGSILAFALIRAVLNYVYAVSINKLVQQKIVVDLRAEVYDKLQRLSFRFFDANSTG